MSFTNEALSSAKKSTPSIKDSRVETYLNMQKHGYYANTEGESKLVSLWNQKYEIAKQEYEVSRCNSRKVETWRNAYEGKLFTIDENDCKVELKPLRKIVYELVEDKVNSQIPAPKMSPRYRADLVSVQATENLLIHEIDKMLSEEVNSDAEHSSLIDGTCWLKVDWNAFDNTHERSGTPIISVCPVDKVFPQPGISDYKRLEYIFEESIMTVSEIEDLYGRLIAPAQENDIIDVISCYYLNEYRHLGRLIYQKDTLTVISNELEWGIRKRRECAKCRTIVNIDNECPVCGSKDIQYFPVLTERLSEDLAMIENPYRNGETTDKSQDFDRINEKDGIPAGTELPHYILHQLPFIPRRNVKITNSIYGISEVELNLETQELVNQFLNKASRKSAASKTYVTKLKNTNISHDDDEMVVISVEDEKECGAIQVKQITSDISEELAMAQLLYNHSKSTSGITDTDQGKQDTSARSGKAKQLQMMASNQRKQGPGVMRNASYAGLYELLFKYLLAFSDEKRSFVSLLPDGSEREECWNKYMFLAKDDNGEYYYRDDFAWSVDTATDITQDRASMWRLIQDNYINGMMGNQIDPVRALEMYWKMMEQYGYPTAKFAIGFIKDSIKHLPTQIEQALVQNPEAVQMAMSYISAMNAAKGGQGGARPNSGPQGNGASHAANIEKTNNKNRSVNGNSDTNTLAESTGGAQGGTR